VQKTPHNKRHNFRISLKKMEVKETKILLGEKITEFNKPHNSECDESHE